MIGRSLSPDLLGWTAGLLAGAGVWLWPATAGAQARDIIVESERIAAFQPGSEQTRFGSLEFVGGLQFWSRDSRLKGVSAIQLTEGRKGFLAVTDTGYWFAGRIERDAEGRPERFGEAVLAPLLDAEGAPLAGKVDADAESLAIDGDRVLVGFERNHRILAYANAANPFGQRAETLPLPIPRAELRTNRGLETLAASPASSALGGAIVAIAEHSIDREGNLFAAIFGGGSTDVFKVKRDDPWDVTDGAFLPGGDLLLLERRYSTFGGLGMRIRRVEGGSIYPGALIDGSVLMEADLGQAIDNMEGLDVSTGEDGATYLTLVSDDNGSFLQRNLLLEFRLVDNGQASSTSAR